MITNSIGVVLLSLDIGAVSDINTFKQSPLFDFLRFQETRGV